MSFPKNCKGCCYRLIAWCRYYKKPCTIAILNCQPEPEIDNREYPELEYSDKVEIGFGVTDEE